MKISIAQTALAAAALVAASGLAVPANAADFGEGKWCAVVSQGGDTANWDCEFDTAEDCAPALATGSRGFCALNPTYQPPPPPQPQQMQPPPPLSPNPRR